jgi:hypothetical protein
MGDSGIEERGVEMNLTSPNHPLPSRGRENFRNKNYLNKKARISPGLFYCTAFKVLLLAPGFWLILPCPLP